MSTITCACGARFNSGEEWLKHLTRRRIVEGQSYISRHGIVDGNVFAEQEREKPEILAREDPEGGAGR